MIDLCTHRMCIRIFNLKKKTTEINIVSTTQHKIHSCARTHCVEQAMILLFYQLLCIVLLEIRSMLYFFCCQFLCVSLFFFHIFNDQISSSLSFLAAKLMPPSSTTCLLNMKFNIFTRKPIA